MRELHGSISAEHGVGSLKRDEITHYKSPVEIELMRRIKRALDPANLMNPGKLVSAMIAFGAGQCGGSGPFGFSHGAKSAQDSRHRCWPKA